MINPGYSTAHLVYSVILATAGRIDEAIEQDALAASLDPLSLIVNWNASSTLFYARRYDEALAQAKRAAGLAPSSTLPLASLGRIYEQMGNYKAELDIMEDYLTESAGGKAVVAKLRQAYETGGLKGFWSLMLQLHNPHGPMHRGDAINLAMIYTRLGDNARALTELEKAYAEHTGDMIFINIEPCFDPLRGEPRFQALVRRVGLTPRA